MEILEIKNAVEIINSKDSFDDHSRRQDWWAGSVEITWRGEQKKWGNKHERHTGKDQKFLNLCNQSLRGKERKQGRSNIWEIVANTWSHMFIKHFYPKVEQIQRRLKKRKRKFLKSSQKGKK